MSRGVFDFMSAEAAYKEQRKTWYVQLQQSTCTWHDLVINPINPLDEKDPIVIFAKDLKEKVEKTLEKRFIYFLASRPKLRFDLKRPPRYSIFSGRLILNILIGKRRKRRRVYIRMLFLDTGAPSKPKVKITDRLITIFQDVDRSVTTSIHDFLNSTGASLGYSSHVHYVGSTKNPHTRPLNGEHRGLSRMLATVSNEENDYFIYTNLFKVTSIAHNQAYGLVFSLSNAMMNEVPVEPEGALVEYSLIAYFDSNLQPEHEAKERAKLRNELTRAKNKFGIESFIFDIEMESANTYFEFYSEKRSASERHVFRVQLDNDELSIQRISNAFDAYRFLLMQH